MADLGRGSQQVGIRNWAFVHECPIPKFSIPNSASTAARSTRWPTARSAALFWLWLEIRARLRRRVHGLLAWVSPRFALMSNGGPIRERLSRAPPRALFSAAVHRDNRSGMATSCRTGAAPRCSRSVKASAGLILFGLRHLEVRLAAAGGADRPNPPHRVRGPPSAAVPHQTCLLVRTELQATARPVRRGATSPPAGSE